MPRVASGRRFTIADGMILIAAVTVALGLSRSYMLTLAPLIRAPDGSERLGLVHICGVAQCFAMAGSVAMIPIRLRAPRPTRRRLARQPGFIASCAAGGGLLPGFVSQVVSLTPWYSRLYQSDPASLLANSSGASAPVVAGA
jgi:hypothetical protein